MGWGPWQAERLKLRGKVRPKQSERAEPVTMGPRLEQARAETCQESRKRSETASKSQSAPQEPTSWGLVGARLGRVPRGRGEEGRGEWRLRAGACRAGPGGGGHLPVLGAGECGQAAMSPGFQDPGPAPAPQTPTPACRHSRILVGRRAGLPRGPRIDGETLWRWVVWLGRGERAVHGGPLPRLRRWPSTNPKRGLLGSREEGQVEKERAGQEGRKGKGENGGGKGREERGKEQMEGKEGGKEGGR